MSELESRVGVLEREQARQGERLGRIELDVGKIGAGVDKLLERDAGRPQGLTWKIAGATIAGLVPVAYVFWWAVESTPGLVQLRERLGRLDDAQTGRVPALERKVDTLGAWRVRVVREGR